MKLNELTTPFQKRRVVTYNANKTKALFHNKQLQHVTGNIYRAENEKDGYNSCCDIYACYPAVPVGIWITSISSNYTVDELMEHIQRNGFETLESYLENISTRLKNQGHFLFVEIEFFKHIDPKLVEQMTESCKKNIEAREKRNQALREKRESENKAYVCQKNTEADQTVNKALHILKNGGILDNKLLTYYKSRYEHNSYSIVNYLMRKYSIPVPIRTQGWINQKLKTATIKNGECVSLQYLKAKNAQCSQKFFDCMNELILAVVSEEIS